MSTKSLSLVNQKLAYAGALLSLITEQESAQNRSFSLQRNALLEASVYHLVCAYQHYLREIAENFQVKFSAPISTEQDLVAALAQLGKNPSEATELEGLRAKKNSWLACLHRSYEEQRAAPVSAMVKTVLDENLIGAKTVDTSAELIEASLRNVMAWQRALTDLIQRHRETCAEY